MITGVDDYDYLHNLDLVLRRLSEAGMRLHKDKCMFMAPEVRYLGHTIYPEDRHPRKDKVHAIAKAPTPTNETELKAHLGLLNYDGKFLPSLSSKLILLQKGRKLIWESPQQKAFEKSK